MDIGSCSDYLVPCRIRKCEERDWPELERFYRAQEGKTIPHGCFEQFQQNMRSSSYLVAEHQDILVAGGGLVYDSEFVRARLTFGIVRPESQRKGIGTTMVLARLSLIPAESVCTEVRLTATEWSKPFLERFGFGWLAYEWVGEVLLYTGLLSLTRKDRLTLKSVLLGWGIRIDCNGADFVSDQFPNICQKEVTEIAFPWVRRPLNENEKRLLARYQTLLCSRRRRLVRTIVAVYAPLATLSALSLSFGEPFLITIPFFVLLISGIFLHRQWRELHERLIPLRSALETGFCHEFQVLARTITKLLGCRNGYAIELENQLSLLVVGRAYRESPRFPCRHFTIRRFGIDARAPAVELVCSQSAKCRLDGALSRTVLNYMMLPRNTRLFEGPLEEVLANLQTPYVKRRAQRPSSKLNPA